MFAIERIHDALTPFLTAMCLAACLVGFAQTVWGNPQYEQGVSLHSSKPTLLDGFGFAVASEGNAVVVGAPHAAGSRGQMGKAFLLQRETGQVLHTFLPPSPVGDDLFGLSVGLTDRVVVVGAPRGGGKLQRRAGKVAVFDRDSGMLVREIVSPNPTAAVFGHAVATQGLWLAIGDPGASSTTNFEVGEVYVFEMTTGRLIQTFVAPGSQQGKPDGFGHALAFVGSGLAIGAPMGGTEPMDQGMVHVFDILTGRLVRTLESPEPQSNEYFGWSLASDAESFLIGALGHGTKHVEAGAAYLYSHAGDFQGSLKAPHSQKGDHFGESVALLKDYYVVAAPGDDAAGVDAGAVYIFDKPTGKLQFTIHNPSKTTGAADLFGLAMMGKGVHLAVGAPYGDLPEMPDAGEVHQYRFQPIHLAP